MRDPADVRRRVVRVVSGCGPGHGIPVLHKGVCGGQCRCGYRCMCRCRCWVGAKRRCRWRRSGLRSAGGGLVAFGQDRARRNHRFRSGLCPHRGWFRQGIPEARAFRGRAFHDLQGHVPGSIAARSNKAMASRRQQQERAPSCCQLQRHKPVRPDDGKGEKRPRDGHRKHGATRHKACRSHAGGHGYLPSKNGFHPGTRLPSATRRPVRGASGLWQKADAKRSGKGCCRTATGVLPRQDPSGPGTGPGAFPRRRPCLPSGLRWRTSRGTGGVRTGGLRAAAPRRRG